jgi:arylsulfatase A-like enzyme
MSANDINTTMKPILIKALISIALCLTQTLATTAAETTSLPTEHPNLIIVLVDEMRGQALGFLNEDPVVTPRLDRFSEEALVLPQAVSNQPVCSPYRAMLMTGKYPSTNGVSNNCNSATAPYGSELNESDRCWSDVLKDQGYSLGYIGKWHLDSPREPYLDCKNNDGKIKWNEWCPPSRRHGFDYWYSYGTYDYHLNPMYWNTDAQRTDFHYVKQWGPEHEADMAINYLKNTDGTYREPNKPFALVVSVNPPHSPYNMFPPKYLEPYKDKTVEDLIVRDNVDLSGDTEMSQHALKQTKNYFANITGVDEQFGRILDQIKESGLSKNTIVLFTSDHGNCLGTHEETSKNNHYEESMRVPFLVRWPEKITPRTDDLLISSPDIYPTLLGLMGFESEIPPEVQGTNHAGIFLNDEGLRPSSQLYLRGVYSNRQDYGRRGVRTERYKLMINKERNKEPEFTLYDRQNDPYELKNIAEQSPETLQQLIHRELIPWLQKTNDPWIVNTKR